MVGFCFREKLILKYFQTIKTDLYSSKEYLEDEEIEAKMWNGTVSSEIKAGIDETTVGNLETNSPVTPAAGP